MTTTLQELEAEIITCRQCPRLVAWREEVAVTKRRAYQDEDYWGKPVPGFGDPDARIMIVGLAPRPPPGQAGESAHGGTPR
jgi:uracil-DNA glycosylase